jgi:DNA invertase Pin-like site-specific DNA recombinase
MKKFTALYIYINAARAPGSAGIQAEALSNWCIENGVTNYRYFADHENVTTIEGEEMNVRAALTRMVAKVKKQKVSQVVCFELDQLGSSPLEQRFVLDTCNNLSTPVVSLAGPSPLEDVQKGIDRWVFKTDESVPPAEVVTEIVSVLPDDEMELTTDIKMPPKKRGRKMTRNVNLINQLLDEGQSLSKIAKAAGCSRATVQLQKKIWSRAKESVAHVTEPPLKVPDRLPASLFEPDAASNPSNLNVGAPAYV